MNSSMTSRQTACVCCLSLLALKLVELPSLLTKLAKTSAIVVTAILLALEFLLLYLFLLIKDKYPNYSLFELIKKVFGSLLAKFIYFVLAIVFVCKLSLLLNEGVVYMKNIVDEEFKITIFLFTFLPVITAMVYSGLRSTARTCEFGFLFIVVGLVTCLFLAKVDLKFGEVGPVFASGLNNIIKSCFDVSFWFTDFLFILILNDKIKKEKNTKKIVLFYVFFIDIILIIFYIIYFRLFRETGYIHETAIANITQYKKNIGNVGNADIIETLVYLFTIYFQGGIYLTCLCTIFKKITNDNNIFHSLIVINCLIIIIQCVIFYNLEMFIKFAISYLKYSTILVWGIIPIFYLFLLIFDRRKNVKVYKRKIETSQT